MFARTKRLLLRPGWAEDAAELAQAIAHESVVTKLARAPWPYGLSDAEAFLAMPCKPHEPRFLVFDRPDSTPRLVGGIGIDVGNAATGNDFGYWFTPEVWGRGYATEAGAAVVDMARHALPLRRLDSAYFVDNPASGRVLAKLGFRPTGRIEPRHSRARGGEADCAVMVLDLDEGRAPVPIAA